MKPIEIKEEEKKQMLEEIHCFFQEEHDLNLGIIGTETIYDFFCETIGNRIYNQAVDDVRRFYQKKQEDADADSYMLYRE